MIEKIYSLYAYLFCRRVFKKFNELMYQLSLRGLGVLNYKGDYLVGEKQWLKQYLRNKNNPVVMDVGANVGRYSFDALEINKNSRIIAFEPHPKTYNKLVNNVQNNNFKAYNFAVGNSDGKIKLYDYDNNDGSSHASLHEDVIKDLHQGSAISHDVDIITLSSFFEKRNISSIDLLKIDTEGNEFDVLKGAGQYLKDNKIKAIHFEFNEMNIISKTSFKDFLDFLPNYDMYRILAGGQLLKIEKYSPVLCEIYAFQNIVAILK